jgi:hypothetical protein
VVVVRGSEGPRRTTELLLLLQLAVLLLLLLLLLQLAVLLLLLLQLAVLLLLRPGRGRALPDSSSSSTEAGLQLWWLQESYSACRRAAGS